MIYKKTYTLRSIQKEFATGITKKVFELNSKIKNMNYYIQTSFENLDYHFLELHSSLIELQLNINTIIMNFGRITGIKMKNTREDLKIKDSFFKKIQIHFLLDKDISDVYSQKLLYLLEEVKNQLKVLEEDINLLILEEFNIDFLIKKLKEIDQNYFRINSELNMIIEEVNDTIERIYSSISSNKDTNINLSFLLISAFLSVILFFPEFNNMLNLQDDTMTYEDEFNQILYEKLIEEVSLDELLKIKDSSKNSDIIEVLENKEVKDIIKTNIKKENERLKKEKNRIKFFVSILLITIIPFLVWVIFITL